MVALESSVYKKRSTTILKFLIIAWMAMYPIYTSYYKAYAIEQYERHRAHMEGHSMFFNPWQYRVLCPMLIEGIYQVFDHTVYRVVPVHGVNLGLPGDTSGKNDVTQKMVVMLKNPEFIKYSIVFVGFRFLLNILVLWLAFQYLSLFVRNRLMVWMSIMLLVLFMGNSVVDSDLTFNTYMDIAVYLMAGLVIMKGYNYWWILPITIVGVLNRETSILIPALFFCAKTDWSKWPRIGKILFYDSRAFIVTAVSYTAFVIIFVYIRMYYGYEPQSTWRMAAGWPMLKLNLFSAVSVKTYMEMFGVLGFLPIWCILFFKSMNKRLKIFFLVLVPIWFGVHIASAIGYQTRLFLVPVVMVFLPAVFEHIEQSYVAASQRKVKFAETEAKEKQFI